MTRHFRAMWWIAPCLWAASAACDMDEQTNGGDGDGFGALSLQGVVPSELHLGITPGAGAKATATRLDPLAEYLRDRLGRPVTMRVAAGYGELGRLLDSGEVHAGIFSPLSWVEQRGQLPAVSIASATRRGAPTYLGYLVVADANRPHSLDALRGSHVVWVSRSSTSGYLYPRLLMRWRGLDPETFFDRESFAGDHLEVIRRVAEGHADVGAVASSFVDPGPGLRIPEADQLTVVAKTARIPLDRVAVRDDLQRDFVRKLRKALLAMDDAHASRELRRTWGIDGFASLDGWRYDRVAQALERESD